MSNTQDSSLVPVAGFSQQGQVDWVAMGNSVFSMSYSILQRFADAGIQPLTHHAGLAISTQFRLSEKGNQRVRDALDNLRVSYGFESVLWFGFGHKSFLRLLTERELGVSCAALCACLGETYGTPKAAELLQALWDVNDFPKDLQPSRSQFGTLVSSCCGLFLSTPFADIVQRMTGPGKVDSWTQGAPASQDLAATINGLFQVSLGRLKAIDIHGGIDIAFLSAMAYWLFDLSIWVQMHDGSVLFSNCSHLEEAVVRLHYTKEDPRQRSVIQISATTFVLGSVSELIIEDFDASITFRAKWESCLTQVIGYGARRVQDQASLLGKALGAIARIYEAIASHEVDVGGFSRFRFVNYQTRGHGRSFVSSIGTVLPEIGSNQAFLDGAEQSLSQTVARSVNTIYALIRQLEERCSCSVCKRKTFARDLKLCNVAALLFLRNIGDIMAHVDLDSSIDPTVDGLHAIYSSQLSLWNDVSRRGTDLITKGAHRTSCFEVAVGIPCISDTGPNIEKLQPTGLLLNSIFDQVARLFMGTDDQEEFNGRRTMSTKPHCTALSRAGVCMWLDALRNANADPSTMSTIHVLPGQIYYRNRQYTSVWDMYEISLKRLGPNMPPATFALSGASADLPMEVPLSNLGLQALVMEPATEGTLRFAFQVKNRSDLRYLQPGILTEALLAFTGLFPCSRTPDCSNAPPASSYLRISGWDFHTRSNNPLMDKIRFNDGGAFLLWAAHDPISKLLAIEGLRMSTLSYGDKDRLSLPLLGSRQCMVCLASYWQRSKNTLITERMAYTNPQGLSTYPNPKCFIHIV